MKNSPATLADRKRKRAHWRDTVDRSTVPPTVMRVCKGCLDVRPCEWNHAFSTRGKPEYRTRCAECFLKNLRAHRKKVRPQLSRAVTRRRISLKLRCIEILGGSCLKCGYSKSFRSLTFHHRDPRTKVGDVCKMIANRSWGAVLEELQKCDLLCFNCHMELPGEHDDVFQVPGTEDW